jgi:hypothetical protein
MSWRLAIRPQIVATDAAERSAAARTYVTSAWSAQNHKSSVRHPDHLVE